MQRHSENALALAKFLEQHPKVAWVNYPGLEGNKYHELQKNICLRAQAARPDFRSLKGGRAAGEEVLTHLKLTSIIVHVGDIRTSVLHPASTTHRQLTEEEQIAEQASRLNLSAQQSDSGASMTSSLISTRRLNKVK